MRSVRKYVFMADMKPIEIPKESKVIGVAMIKEEISFLVLVDSNQLEIEDRCFIACRTDEPIMTRFAENYIGTVYENSEAVHMFEAR